MAKPISTNKNTHRGARNRPKTTACRTLPTSKAPDGLFYNDLVKPLIQWNKKWRRAQTLPLHGKRLNTAAATAKRNIHVFQGDGKTDFNEQKYSPWDEEQAKAYCMSSAANEGKSPDGLFYNRPCEAVEDHDGGQYRNDIDTCLDSKSIENCI